MPHKQPKSASPPWNLLVIPRPHWRFWVLTMAVLLGMMLFWSIDGCTINNLFEAWIYSRTYPTVGREKTQINPNLTREDRHMAKPIPKTTLNYTENRPNLINNGSLPFSHPANLTFPQTPIYAQKIARNRQKPKPAGRAPARKYWVSVELEENYTSKLLAQWIAPGGKKCGDSPTAEIAIPDLDGKNERELPTGEIHEFVFQALDEFENPRCLGGDYFETDISGERWKARPPVKDFGNGTYSLKLQIHPDFAGVYNLTVILLFRHFEGLKLSTRRFAFDKQLRHINIRFYRTNTIPSELQSCTKSDLNRDIWSGRWTRHGKNDSCEISNDGRYRCLKPNFPCQNPWCKGPLGALESNGWVYSSHCSFNLFTAQPAWNCLNKRWIFLWGDSNHVDSIRNLLLFILDSPQQINEVSRRFDSKFTNPRNRSQTVRITNVFNGHWNETKNYIGLDSLGNAWFRDLVRSYFSGETVPDAIIMNSGLHDAFYWMNVKRFARGADYAASFWSEVLGTVRARGITVPTVIFRSTVATGGYARTLAFNPNKMEVFNGVFLEKLRKRGIVDGVIDDFDMTYPWHYDNRCNDGVHYGRAPAKMRWRDGHVGHQYFVDLMLVHVWLNALCAR